MTRQRMLYIVAAILLVAGIWLSLSFAPLVGTVMAVVGGLALAIAVAIGVYREVYRRVAGKGDDP